MREAKGTPPLRNDGSGWANKSYGWEDGFATFLRGHPLVPLTKSLAQPGLLSKE